MEISLFEWERQDWPFATAEECEGSDAADPCVARVLLETSS